MRIVFDVADLLQLQEIWSWRPIVTAFTRLERRETAALPGAPRFDLDELLPRLHRLRLSPDWRQNHQAADPARIPIRDFSETDFSTLYPETDGAAARQNLFGYAYQAFVVAQYQGDAEHTRAALLSLAAVRQLDPADYLDAYALPRQGSPDWIPADITDEIRGLDVRYNLTEPGTPAAYVIADSFWPLLVKAEDADIEAAAALGGAENAGQHSAHRRALAGMVEVARVWNRSPSVVGLCYQINSGETSEDTT